MSLNLKGCGMIPCKLEIGSSYEIQTTLEANFQSDSLVQSADIYLSDHNVYIPLLITPENLCWTLPCPVKTSKYVKLNGNFTIPENAFKVSAKM
ncbi:hypothetical protein RI129_003365 [Pyrocoelia pectoralis]|uniref:MD-2-related lipid-recognition domain-containing protein n=1 Tax=Pyrocoelia pectoralis TaxID=417401 RepID=A0AAN7ZUZ4_9COLE